MSFKTFLQKIGLVAKTKVSKVEGVVGIVSAATKESLKSLVPTKDYTMTVTTGFNGEKFYALAPDGSTVKGFDTYDELVAYVQPVVAPVVVPVVHNPIIDQEDALQAQIDALQIQKDALKAQE